MVCGLCDRAMDSHWGHDRAGYRCRQGHNSARIPRQDREANIYVRQDQVRAFLAEHIADLAGLTTWDDSAAAIALARFQQDHEVAVICERYTWRLEVDHACVFYGWPPRLPCFSASDHRPTLRRRLEVGGEKRLGHGSCGGPSRW